MTDKKKSPGALGGKLKKKKYVRKNNRLSGMPRSHAAAPEGLMHYLVGVTDKFRGISEKKRDEMGGVLPKGLRKTKHVFPNHGDTISKSKRKASEVSKNIIKGYKKGSPVKFTPKPEKPLSPEAIKKQLKKQSKKYGGKIKNRNMGGVIGGGLASKDVTDYLYKYDS